MENVITKVLDNRALILALDYLYRENMKRFETEELLEESRKLIRMLSLSVVDVPVEGYYHESEELKEYFLNVRTLQQCPLERKKEVEHLDSYQILSKVTDSEIYGKGKSNGFLPQRLDPLFYALQNIPVSGWAVESITSEAHSISVDSDDISLVGIAASINDSVVLAALRESVALYGAVAAGSAMIPPKIVYRWDVDSKLQSKVNLFIKIFNELSSSNIKEAGPENVEYYYDAFEDNEIFGRCIYVGYDDTKTPIEMYHWAIKYEAGSAIVDDFWSEDLWTTERYKDEKLYA
ncbi:hypothetical protein TDB9533_04810 [Thalassocella blandensis]|nr:hypothetical protein TDB9533_04810 [Thalassocella blandensis]